MGPGQTALTRIFSLARRTARLFTKPTTPNLHMEYTGLYEEPWSPDVEAVKRRLPPPRRRISGMAASVVRSTVRRFKSMARSKAAMSMPSTAAGPGCPTWFHTKSRPLKRPTVSHTMRRASSSLVRSATMPCAAPHAGRVHVHHRDLRAFLREPEGPGASHARGRRRHDSDLSAEAHRSPFGSPREGPILYRKPFKRYRAQGRPTTACGILRP